MERPSTFPAPEENTVSTQPAPVEENVASTQDIEVQTSRLTEGHEYKLEIIPPYSIIQCRRSDIIYRNGKEIARSYHRHVCHPGDDVSYECAEVQAVAAALWTPEVVAAYTGNYLEASTMPSEEEPEVSTMPSEEEPEVSTMPSEEEPEVSTADLESEV